MYEGLTKEILYRSVFDGYSGPSNSDQAIS
jgi:hypothetical protein